MPVGYAKLLSNPRFHWQYRTEPELALQGRALDVPCGRVLGGTGSINGMLYVRGHRDDYDGWRDAGNPEWDYASVLPWFRRSEANTRGADAFHGGNGPARRRRCAAPPSARRRVRRGRRRSGISAQRRLQRRARRKDSATTSATRCAGGARAPPPRTSRRRASGRTSHVVTDALADRDRVRRPPRGRRRLSPARRRNSRRTPNATCCSPRERSIRRRFCCARASAPRARWPRSRFPSSPTCPAWGRTCSTTFGRASSSGAASR